MRASCPFAPAHQSGSRAGLLIRLMRRMRDTQSALFNLLVSRRCARTQQFNVDCAGRQPEEEREEADDDLRIMSEKETLEVGNSAKVSCWQVIGIIINA